MPRKHHQIIVRRIVRILLRSKQCSLWVITGHTSLAYHHVLKWNWSNFSMSTGRFKLSGSSDAHCVMFNNNLKSYHQVV